MEDPPEQFRADAGVLDGVDLLGGGAVADVPWARPAVTVLGIDCPPVVGSAAAVPAQARARINLRLPPHNIGLASDAGDAAAWTRLAASWIMEQREAPTLTLTEDPA